MPLRWTISPLEHIVVCVFEGVVTLADIAAYFAALEAAGASHYRKILDAMHGQVDAVVVSTPDHMHAPITMRARSSTTSP